jgi:hypothetical protein
MEGVKSFLIVVTRKEPAEAYVVQKTTRDELYDQLEKACHLTRRGQMFVFDTPMQVKDMQLQGIPNIIKLKGVGDVYLNGEKEVILDRYINLTEEMTAEAALPELRRAARRLAEEIEKCEGEIETGAPLASEVKQDL